MLKILRKKGVAKKILWFITIIIVISFGFFGTAYLLTNQGPSDAGKIFGRKIPLNEFAKSYEEVRANAVIHYGEKFHEVEPYLDLESETWDHLILLREAQKRHIAISNQDVIAAIQEYPFFKRNDQFDELLYNNILRYVFKMMPRDFEESVRNSLKIARLYKQETNSLTLSDEEIFDAYKRQNEKVQVSYILVSPEQFKNDTAIDEAAARDYYQKHQEEFFEPPMINTEYLFLPFPKTKDNTDESETKEGIRHKAQTIYETLLQDPNMEKAASQNNLEVKQSGFFSQEQPNLNLGWPFELLTKVFVLNVNDMAEPTENLEGIYIVKLKEKKEAQVPDYEQVKIKAQDIVLHLKAKALAQQKAKEYLQSIKEKLDSSNAENFTNAGKDLGLQIYQTPVFSRGQYLPELGIAKDFEEEAFHLNANHPTSDIVETEKGYCLLHLDQYVAVTQKDFEKGKENIGQELFVQKSNETFNTFLTHLRLKANIQNNLPKRNEKQNL